MESVPEPGLVLRGLNGKSPEYWRKRQRSATIWLVVALAALVGFLITLAIANKDPSLGAATAVAIVIAWQGWRRYFGLMLEVAKFAEANRPPA